MPGLLPYGDDSGEKAPLFAWPKGAVLFIGLLCFLCFLVEGAVIDWSAVFLITERGSSIGLAGLAYAAFAVAMTLGRLTGDRLRTILGEQRVLLIGGILAAAGFATIAFVPTAYANLVGFLLVGAGASNVVPVLFSRSRAHPCDAAEPGGDGRDHARLPWHSGRPSADRLRRAPDGPENGIRPAGGRHAVHRSKLQGRQAVRPGAPCCQFHVEHRPMSTILGAGKQ